MIEFGKWGSRSRGLVVALVAAALTLAGLTGTARAVVPSDPACPANSDYWVGGQTVTGDTTPNNWNAAANWSSGIPTAATNVCLDNSEASGSYTVNIDGDGSIASNQVANSITIVGSGSNVITLALLGAGGGVQTASPLTLTNQSAGGGVTATGAITLGSTPSTLAGSLAGGQPGLITVTAGTLVNQGTITSQAFANPGAANTINGGFDNEGTLNVVQNLNSNGPDASSGTVNIASGETWSLGFAQSDSGFTQTAGTINNQGTFQVDDGGFSASGGTSTGNPLQLTSDRAGVDVDLAGSSTDVVHTQTGGANLTGNIGPGATLWASGEPGYAQGGLFIQGPYTNQGTLQLGAGGTDQTQGIVYANNGTFTNAGTLISINNATGGPNSIDGPFTNTGAMSLQGSLSGTGQITNLGAVTLAPGMNISATSFAQAAPGTLSVGIVANSSALQNPVLSLSGAASLGGGLSVTTSGTQSANVTLVKATSVAGTFPSPAFAGQTYSVVYAPTSVTLSTTAPVITQKPARAKVIAISGGVGAVRLKLSCPTGGAACAKVAVRATVTEKLKAHKGHKAKIKVVTVATGTASLVAGATRSLTLKLNRAGKARLKGHRTLRVKVTISAGGKVIKTSTAVVTGSKAKHKEKKH
jgi:hypothetical protein